MTSKSPVRSCDDVDEESLSYAEIKALCAGNPHIKEKMELDIEVAKLRLLKSEHQSQRYRLEDDLRLNFPKNIERYKGLVEGFKADISRLETNTHRTEEGISPMVIGDKTYTDRGEAGEALLTIVKDIRMSATDKIGSYRGFDMYSSFDSFEKVFRLDLKGSMTHTTNMGADPSGNITRINNTFDKIPDRLRAVETQIAVIQQQIESAKVELYRPFAHEVELTEKSSRLAVIDALLNMDENPEVDSVQPKSESQGLLEAAKLTSHFDNPRRKRDDAR